MTIDEGLMATDETKNLSKLKGMMMNGVSQIYNNVMKHNQY